jgi:3-dehydroquinate dehydratase II
MPPPRKRSRPPSAAGAGRRGTASQSPRVLFLDGPNLNVLGRREPHLYGARSLEQIRRDVAAAARREGAAVDFFQSNHEGELVARLQEAAGRADGIVINPGGYTHTSVAIRDALIYAGVPAVEVHLSNPARREPFRRTSLIEDVVVGRIAGFGGFGYVIALHALLDHLRQEGGRGRA